MKKGCRIEVVADRTKRIVFLVGSWYSRKELGKRNAWITMCGSLGGALTGLVQAGLLKWFDGFLGISGYVS